MKKNDFMSEALKEAQKAFDQNEVPIGAIIVENDKIIARAHNSNLTNKDPSAHAEIVALRQAALARNSSRLDSCDIYVTLEPCAMCAAAISLARIRRVYYAAADEKFGAVENGVRFFQSASCFHVPEVYSEISQKESVKILQDFFQRKR
jgi:tRNA(adenine34) deaminase